MNILKAKFLRFCHCLFNISIFNFDHQSETIVTYKNQIKYGIKEINCTCGKKFLKS